MRKGIYVAALALASALTAAGGAEAADVSVTVRGVVPGGGKVMAALFDSQEAFDAGRRFAGQQLFPADKEVVAVFNNVPPGRYMAAVYQDANGDEKLNVNAFGVPVEAYGFGGEPPRGFGPPGFDAAAVMAADAPIHLTATLAR